MPSFVFQSMGICFIGQRKFQDFINEYIESKPGHFINIENNEIVGMHKGFPIFLFVFTVNVYLIV